MNIPEIAEHTEPTLTQLLDTAAWLERRLDRTLSGLRGVSYREYRLLKTLAESEADGLPRIVLAESVGLSASAVTRALKPLEKIGFVTTEKGERDARQSRAVITPAGLELLEHAKTIMHDVLRELPLNALSPQKVTDFRNRLQEMR